MRDKIITQAGGIFSLVPSYNSLTEAQKKQIDSIAPAEAPRIVRYSGFEELDARGIETDQIAILKFAINDFAVKNKVDLSIAAVSNVAVLPRGETETLEHATFDLRLDGVKYFGTLEYSGVSSARLTIRDDTGKQIYDSGTKNSLD